MKYTDIQAVLRESSLSRLWSKTENHVCGAVTGYRSENTAQQNKANNAKLVNYLQGKGYSVTKVSGSYIENFNTPDAQEVSEPSYFVCNHRVQGDDGGQLQDDLVRIGAQFDQDSVLIVPVGGADAYLVGTSQRENAWPAYGQTEVVGTGKWGDSLGPFFSRVGGRKFAFEDMQEPQTRNGRWAQHILIKQIDGGDQA